MWELAHASRFAELSAALADVLPPLEDAVRSTDTDDERSRLHALRARAYQAASAADTDDERSRLHALRARVYQAVSAAFARQDEQDAAWVAADRAISAAELAGDPLDVIAGHFRLAHAFIRLRRYDQAEHVITAAVDVLTPAADDNNASPELLSIYGAMHLARAVLSGREGDRSAARANLAKARAIADRIGEDRNDYDTEFGPTNVLLHAVAVDVDLGDAGEALDIANQVDVSGLSPERQARFLIDVARAHAQRRHIGDAAAALVEADRLAPEHVRTHHDARACLDDLLAQAGRRPPADLLALAQRAGVG